MNMIYGTLTQNTNGEWFVKHDITNDIGYDISQIHPEHNMWLLIHGHEGLKVCFELLDNNIARLKACFPDTHEYTQD